MCGAGWHEVSDPGWNIGRFYAGEPGSNNERLQIGGLITKVNIARKMGVRFSLSNGKGKN